MKIRHGFVSNSSSSSFCIITTKDDYDKALQKVEKWDTDVSILLKNILGVWKKIDLKGVKGIALYGTIYSDSYYDAAYEIFQEASIAEKVSELAYDAMDILFNEIDKLGGFAEQY